jgi:hypothetical protein
MSATRLPSDTAVPGAAAALLRALLDNVLSRGLKTFRSSSPLGVRQADVSR